MVDENAGAPSPRARDVTPRPALGPLSASLTNVDMLMDDGPTGADAIGMLLGPDGLARAGRDVHAGGCAAD